MTIILKNPLRMYDVGFDDRPFTEEELAWFKKGDMHEATLKHDGKPIGSHVQDSAKALDPKASQPPKAAIQYVPVALIEACAEALAEGRIKYGTAKWRETQTSAMTYVGGVLRHLYAWIDGEELDPESITGKRHLAGAAASLAILLDCIANGTLTDDRPPAGPGAKLMRSKK